MISYIKGPLTAIEEDVIVVEAGGVGMGIHVPLSVLDRLPGIGREVTVYTYFQVREDAMSLYGFLKRQDRDMFRQLIGVNGVGKTTLSRCLCGLLREQAGTVRLHGRPLGRKERQRAAFCVMQDVNHQLFSDSVWGECRISAPDAPDEKIAEVLDRLQLLSFRERHPMALSGGQKQRLAVATALLSEKPVLIFDEPTSGLDYARMVEVSGVIRDLARQGRIVLVVTHDQEFLQQACDRVLHL